MVCCATNATAFVHEYVRYNSAATVCSVAPISVVCLCHQFFHLNGNPNALRWVNSLYKQHSVPAVRSVPFPNIPLALACATRGAFGVGFTKLGTCCHSWQALQCTNLPCAARSCVQYGDASSGASCSGRPDHCCLASWHPSGPSEQLSHMAKPSCGLGIGVGRSHSSTWR